MITEKEAFDISITRHSTYIIAKDLLPGDLVYLEDDGYKRHAFDPLEAEIVEKVAYRNAAPGLPYGTCYVWTRQRGGADGERVHLFTFGKVEAHLTSSLREEVMTDD